MLPSRLPGTSSCDPLLMLFLRPQGALKACGLRTAGASHAPRLPRPQTLPSLTLGLHKREDACARVRALNPQPQLWALSRQKVHVLFVLAAGESRWDRLWDPLPGWAAGGRGGVGLSCDGGDFWGQRSRQCAVARAPWKPVFRHTVC